MKKTQLPSAEQALPGRNTPMSIINRHFVNANPIQEPFPAGLEKIVFGMGCFWGAERRFWQQHGVFSTAVGYTNGITPNPSYEELCTGLTGHNEVVLVVYDPQQISLQQLLQLFWQAHNPTQGMRQGNDVGSQYRSGIYCYNAGQLEEAEQTKQHYQARLNASQMGEISTEICMLKQFYYAENHHQQYLAKNPAGYCGLGGTGVKYD